MDLYDSCFVECKLDAQITSSKLELLMLLSQRYLAFSGNDV